ncbi:hypothetical protein ACFQ1I_14940 [Kitasatospora arboriphila]
MVEQQPVEREQAGGVALPGLPGHPVPADLQADVVGEQDGVQRQPFLGAAGCGLPDGGELLVRGGFSGADGPGEGADAALGGAGEFAVDLFAGQPPVGGQGVEQRREDRPDEFRQGGQQPLVRGDAADRRDVPPRDLRRGVVTAHRNHRPGLGNARGPVRCGGPIMEALPVTCW